MEDLQGIHLPRRITCIFSKANLLKISFSFSHMKAIILSTLFAICTIAANAQLVKTELYDLIKKVITDSTGYENIGNWAVGKPKKFPVKWKADKMK